MDRNVWVYDIETLKSCFTYTAINIDTLEIVQYVIHKTRNDTLDLVNHLEKVKGHIGFNNVNFDYPVIHKFLKNFKQWFEEDSIVENIYSEAQRIIEFQNGNNFFEIVAIKQKDIIIPQLDLFKVWHYNNNARSTSLKALEISMNYPNVMDMPISHTKTDISKEEIIQILEYNLNDVMATFEFYKKTVEFGKIDLRKKIMAKFNLPCINWNNGKIGENLILKLYCDKLGLDQWEIRKLRTYRPSIDLSECIPDNIKFKSKEFNGLLNFFKNKTITETKGAIDYSIVYKGIRYDYGTGGIHACIKSGVYESDDKVIIKSLDVASLYPNIPIVYGFWIEHLGEEFLNVYRDNIVAVRLAEKAKPKDQQDKAIVDGYKEAANIPYGKSNDENSFLYDPLYTLKTTIAGQLVITMLCERLCEIPNSQMLMVNTDGCEICIPREHEQMYNDICMQWEKETKLVLEFVDYKKLWIRDINNYGSLTFKGKIKNKGAFEVDKVIGGEPAYHKDNSFRIIPFALQEYFVNGIPIAQTIRNHKNVYDFCGRQKFGKDSHGEIHYIEFINNQYFHKIQKQQKNTRYYISNKGANFVKRYTKGTSEMINKGNVVTIFNKYIEKPIEEYDINYSFYISETQKEIDNIIDKQLSLF